MSQSMFMHTLEMKDRLEGSEINIHTAIADSIHKWGFSFSEIFFEKGWEFFVLTHIDGFIGYKVANQCAVVFGDPVCSDENKPALAEAFNEFCQKKNLNVIYIIASETFSTWAIKHVSKVLIEVGEEIVFLPEIDPTIGPQGNRLRNYIHHASSLGLEVKEYLPINEEIEKQINNLQDTWQKSRKGPQLYLGNFNFFERREDHRWFYVTDNKNVKAAALLSTLVMGRGWLLKSMITHPDAPRGTSELLMTSILNKLHDENTQFITYGIIPAKQLGEIEGLGPIEKWFIKLTFTAIKWIFNLNKRKKFWQKFQPRSKKSFALFSKSIGLKEIRAVLQALKVDY